MINTKALKGATKSKTIWFNVVVGMLLAAESAIPLLQPVLGEATYGIVSFVLIVGNVAFRSLTSKSLGEK